MPVIVGFDADDIGRAVLGDLGEAVLCADSDGIIRYWSPGAERLFGWTRAEVLGRSLDLLIPERLRARHWAGYRHVMSTGRSRYGQGEVLAVPGLRKDGASISLEFTILPLHGGDGSPTGLVAVLRDVTARFEELRRLRQAERIRRPSPDGTGAGGSPEQAAPGSGDGR